MKPSDFFEECVNKGIFDDLTPDKLKIFYKALNRTFLSRNEVLKILDELTTQIDVFITENVISWNKGEQAIYGDKLHRLKDLIEQAKGGLK